MGNKTTGYVVTEFLDAYPHLPSRTIARLIVDKHPGLFSGVESARTAVRVYRGQSGTKRPVAGGRYHRKAGSVTDGFIPIPPPITEVNPWRIVPVDFKQSLNLFDIHMPYHDENAVRLAMKHGKYKGVDCVILGGDAMDFYQLSHWERDPRRRFSLVDDLRTGERFLEVLRDTFRKARIIYLEGNHEQRLWRYAWGHCPELAALEEMNLASLLHCADYGVEVVDEMKPLLAGPHLHILHGHEFGGFMTNPVNPARGLSLRAKVNATCGHFHQTSQHTEPGLGKPVSTWSSGHLGQPHPKYRPINKWNQGFQIVELHKDQWTLENLKIINGVVV